MTGFCTFCSKRYQFEASELGMEKACPRCGAKVARVGIPNMPITQQLRGFAEILGEGLGWLFVCIISGLFMVAALYVVVHFLRGVFGGEE